MKPDSLQIPTLTLQVSQLVGAPGRSGGSLFLPFCGIVSVCRGEGLLLEVWGWEFELSQATGAAA